MAATITQTSKPLHPRALDTSGNNNHGTAYTGQALYFDGVADYISLSDLTSNGVSMSSDVTQDVRTFAFWHKSSESGSLSASNVVFSAAGGGGGTGMGIFFATDGDLKMELKAGGVRHIDTYPAGGADNTWKRYVCIFDGVNKDFSLYVNGVAASTNHQQNVGSWSGSGSSATGFIGSLNAAMLWALDGWLSDFQCWDAVWTASDALYDYNNPEKLALDNSGTSLTYSNLKLWYPMQDGHRGQQSYLMDGSNTGLGSDIIEANTADLGSFDTDTTGSWLKNATLTHNASTGDATLSNLNGSSSWLIYKGSLLKVGTSYRLTFKAKATDNTSYLSLTNGSGTKHSYVTILNPALSTAYQNYEFLFTAVHANFEISASSSSTTYTGDAPDTGDTFTFDDIVVLPINDKNHGTSVFYGDELQDATFTDSDLLGFTSASATGFTGVNTDAGVGSNDNAYGKALSLVAGRQYKLSWTTAINAGDLAQQLDVAVATSTGGGTGDTATAGTHTAAGDYSNTFTAATTDTYYIVFRIAGNGAYNFTISNVSLKEVGFATGWTDADAQPTIPQLGFQSYNQLGLLNGIDSKVVVSNNSALDVGTGDFSFSLWVNATSGSGVQKIFDRNHTIGYTMYISSGNLKVGLHNSLTTIADSNIADGNWHHLVSSYDRSGNLTVYKDGVLIATIDISSDTEDLNNANALVFGQSSSGVAYPFEGTLTEISLWKGEALTTAKVQELYNDGEALDATLHSSAANLSGYWRNRGTGTWTDLSTNSNNGTPTSVSEYLILPEGNNNRDTQGFLMNRTSTSGIQHTGAIAGSYSKFGYGTQLLSTPVSNASVECWFRSFGGTGASESYATFFGSRASNNILLCRNSTAGTVSGLYYLTSGGNQNNLDSTTNCFDDEWHHIAFTFDSGVGKLYIDGSLEATQDDTGDTIRMGSDTYYMETGADSVQGSRSFSGDVDDIAVYSTTLTVNQVARNYKAGKRRHKN